MAQETTKFWRNTDVAHLELLHAFYITHAFAPHVHEGYALGVIEAGAETFTYRRQGHIASAGQVVVIHPGETHTGQAVTPQGWMYRMFYPDPEILRRAASEIAGRQRDLPFFQHPVIQDDQLAAELRRLHLTLEHSPSRLERESQLLWTLAQFIVRHADARPTAPTALPERLAVRRAREYLDQRFADTVSLGDLADHVGLSQYHLLRVFRDALGMPPHAYLTQVRVLRAKALLAVGQPIAAVAAEVGFADQSHLTRSFKRIVGVPPGRYAQG